MSFLPRKCAGCRQRRFDCDTPVGVSSWYCSDCTVAGGIWGTNRRLKNVAEEQSKKWRDGPCPHQTYTNVPYKDPRTGRSAQQCLCNACGEAIYTVIL